MNRSRVLYLMTGALFGAAGTVLVLTASPWLTPGGTQTQKTASDSRPEPLYWVAPMDPGYRRDKPGKSPMGMDLVPVYAESQHRSESGDVLISPAVVNNLGVRTESVRSGRLLDFIDTVGFIRYDEDRLVHIHPRVEGWIEKLQVTAAGDPVSKGEPLFALYSPTLVNAQEELLLASKRNNPALVEAATARLRALQVPASTIHRLRNSGEVSQTITISAPQSGVIESLNVREGMYARPGLEVMSIGQLSTVWVIAEVFEQQVASVVAGASVSMRLDYLPGRTWQGKVDYVYPTLNPDTRTARVRVRFENPDRFLKPGMFAQMKIEASQSGETLLIPRQALIRTGEESRVVLAISDGHYRSVVVRPGRIVGNQVEILSGLEDGQRIVTSAQFLIDSESSRQAGMERLHYQPAVESASATGLIRHIDRERRIITLAREAIEKWQRPAATVEFFAAQSLDLDAFSPGQTVRFTFEDFEETFTITDWKLKAPAPGRSTAELQAEGQQHD